MPPVAPWKGTNQYKRLCFTVNLGDIDTWEDYDLNALVTGLGASFLIAGKETGAEGRKHFQGYAELPKKKYGKAIDEAFRKIFPLPLSCHYEATYGTAKQNIKYCSKEDKAPFTHGKPESKQGERSDIAVAMHAVAAGEPMLKIAEDHPQVWAQYRRALDEYRGMKQAKRTWPTQLIFLWGPTGTGKSMHAMELEPTAVFWADKKYLNGFHGEEVLLFDDFDHESMHWQTFLTITDRYPMTINIKGGFANFAPRTIIFTSNSDPLTWFQTAPAATREAIHRRIEEFGDVRYLGSLVPKETNILTKFLIKKTKEPEPSGAGVDSTVKPAVKSSPLPPPQQLVIDLTDDTDDEDSLSQIILRRAGASYHGIIEEMEDDEE